MHAYVLRDIISEKFGFTPGRITVYKVLYLLEKHGMVKSSKREVNGRLQKVYDVTEAGVKTLEDAKVLVRNFSEKI